LPPGLRFLLSMEGGGFAKIGRLLNGIIRISTRLSRATHGDPIDPIEFHQTGALGRNRGALPRLQVRGEQGDIVTPAYVLSALCIAPNEDVGCYTILQPRRPRSSVHVSIGKR
jgi:hypothetical protein